jgi:signal transduction histidine kinase
MSIQRRLLLLFITILLGMAALVATELWVNRRVEASMQMRNLYRAIANDASALNILTYGYLRDGRQRRLMQWLLVHDSMGERLRDIADEGETLAPLLISDLLANHQDLLPLFHILLDSPGENREKLERQELAIGRLAVKNVEMVDYAVRLLYASQQRTLSLQRDGERTILAVTILLTLLVGGMTLHLVRSITRSLRRMEIGAQRLAAGDLGYRIDLREKNELGKLAIIMDIMAARLESRTEELQTLNREMEAFNYSVSHDLRAPLRGIDGFSQALQEDYADKLDDAGRDYLQRVRQAAQRMGHLIDDLLRLSRISRQQLNFNPVDLSAMAEAIVYELQQREPQHRPQITVTPGLSTRGDRDLLRIALENLLGNAWKFTGQTSKAHIEVGQEYQDKERVFFVRDNGAGFDLAHADKLFTPFQRLHTTSEFPGTGIGISLVQRIIHRHGGRIWATGAPQQGATFYFTLPEEDNHEQTNHFAGGRQSR